MFSTRSCSNQTLSIYNNTLKRYDTTIGKKREQKKKERKIEICFVMSLEIFDGVLNKILLCL